MTIFKRAFSLLLLTTLPFLWIASPPSLAQESLSILALNFPCYDFARVLSAGTAKVRMLLPPGSESHSYEPTPRDIIALEEADLFLYTGGESDHWVEAVLASLEDHAPKDFRLCDCVTLLNEESPKSMQQALGHAHFPANEPDGEGEPEADMDEHVWTSPKNAMQICAALTDELCHLAPQNEALYRQTLSDYLAELTALDDAFTQIVENGTRDWIIFGDRFPFRYFANDYHLRYDAAFPGCSEDSEPSVRTVISLTDLIREEQIPVVFYIEFSSRRTADILAEETGAKPLLFHSCHNVSAAELEQGASYLTLMLSNAAALKEALQ